MKNFFILFYVLMFMPFTAVANPACAVCTIDVGSAESNKGGFFNNVSNYVGSFFKGHKEDIKEDTTKHKKDIVKQESKEIAFKVPVKKVYTTPKKFDISEARVVIQAVDVEDNIGSFIQIKDNKDVVWARVLAPCEVFYVDPNTKYEAWFGNSGVLDIWVDGQLINKLGKKGETKKHISLSPDSLKAYGFAE